MIFKESTLFIKEVRLKDRPRKHIINFFQGFTE